MKRSYIWLPFFVLCLVPSTVHAENHGDPRFLPRYQAPSRSGRLMELVGACLTGRPPLPRASVGSPPVNFPALRARPEPVDPPVHGPEPELPPPPVVEMPRPEPKETDVCRVACTMEYRPVTCEVHYWVGDMGMTHTISGGNECVVRLKACERENNLIDKFESLECEDGYVNEGVPKDTFAQDVVFGSKLDKPEFAIQMLRKDGPDNVMGDLVERDGKYYLNNGKEVFELDLSGLSEQKKAKLLRTRPNKDAGEELGIRGEVSYIEDPGLRKIGGRKHYTQDKHKYARSDMYKLKVSDFALWVE